MRLKAVLPIGPWGRVQGLWDAAGLAGLRVPCLIMGGDCDNVSGYEGGIRRIFDEAGGRRWLLTFQGAGHNAAAPIPAPAEAWEPSDALPFSAFAHYADAVWDNVRMNNIAQHFALNFLNWHLKGQADAALAFGGGWPGFEKGEAPGLRLEARG